MPVINPKHVVSFTSEDKVQCADNLLKAETYRKWRTAGGGEGQASVVLELAKAEEIHSIDVGNEGSTFVEVLVGDADAGAKIDYQVLLGASAFMTPAEAKSWTNLNKVRFFGPEKLNKTAREKKWTRLKIVVTQNFNKTQPFGLAFVKFHSPPEKVVDVKTESKKFGAFSVKDEGSVSPQPITAGSLFDKVKREPETAPPPGGAAALRLAPSLSLSPKPTGLFKFKKDVTSPFISPTNSSAGTPIKTEARTTPIKTEEKPSPSTKATPVSKATPSPSHRPTASFGASPSTPVATSRKRPSSPTGAGDAFSAKKKKLNEKTKAAASVPFAETLRGVTFVLSGYQNPLRGILRDKAMEMGAKYKGDWDESCTHLVCAFSNTPKFQQVLGKGKIVTKRWVEDCYKERKRLLWRDYRLDDGSSGSDSDGEATTTTTTTTTKRKEVKDDKNSSTTDATAAATATATSTAATAAKPEPEVMILEDDVYNASTDVDSDVENDGGRPGGRFDDDPDTEDELERVMRGKTNGAPKPEKEDESALPPLPQLPDFLAGKQFMLFGSFDAALKKLMKRYIIGYGGDLCAYMNDSVDFVVTSSSWDSNFDDAIGENPDLNFVRPKWLKVCHQKSKLVPYQPFIVAPPMDDDDDDD